MTAMLTRARRRWTAEDDAVLRDAAAAGNEGWTSVAARIGRTAPAVRCRACELGLVLSPDVISTIAASAAATRNGNPRYRERHRDACLRRQRSEGELERMRARMAATRAKCFADPNLEARRVAAVAAQLRRRAVAALAWCPADRVEDYRALVKMKGITARDARRMIEADIAKAAARRAAEVWATFDERTAAARRGAGTRMPTPVRAAHDDQGDIR